MASSNAVPPAMGAITGDSTRARAQVRAWRAQRTLGKQENCGGDRASPVIGRTAYGCGRDRRAVDDQTAVFVYLFALVPRGLWIKIQAERRGQHGRREILGLITARLRGHAVSV